MTPLVAPMPPAALDLAAAHASASEVMATTIPTRDAEEGIDAFLAKRKPFWQGR